MLEAATGLAPIREQLAAEISSARDLSDARARLSRWQAENEEPAELVERIYQPALQADLGARLFVVEIEMGGIAPIALDDSRGAPFLRLPFLEAIREFVRRGTTEGGGLGILTPEEFYRLSDEYRTRAFTASRLASQALVERAFSELQRTLEEGGTFEQFATALADGDAVIGPSATGYLETVFRTNVQGAYGAGRFRQITAIAADPDLRDLRPFVEYRTVRDARVRASHAELDGTVYRSDSDAWHRIAPPNGYSCRCGVVLRRAEDIDPARVVDAPPADPDEGFDAPPSPSIEE